MNNFKPPVFLSQLSDRLVRALPHRHGKTAKLDDLMALFAPSAWGVGLEGIEIKAGDCRLVAGCFGAELFYSGNRSGFSEQFRMCLTRCYGHCDYETANAVAGAALQRAAVMSKIFIALANPCDALAWMQARATARAAKANGVFVLLVAAQLDGCMDDLFEEAIASIDHDDVHCVFRAPIQAPFYFLESFAWALMPVLARFARQDCADMAIIRQLLEQRHAVIAHVRYSKKRCTLSQAISYGIEECDRFGLDIKDSAGVIVLLDNRDYTNLTAEELVANANSALPNIAPVHVVVSKVTDGESYEKSCFLITQHDFFMVTAFDLKVGGTKRVHPYMPPPEAI